MSNKGIIAVLGLGGAAAVIITGVAVAKQGTGTGGTGGISSKGSCSSSGGCPSGEFCFNGTCITGSIKVTASASQYTPGGTVQIYAVLSDEQGNNVGNYTLTLIEITSGSSAKSITDSSGKATFDVSFPTNATGDYVFQVQA